MNKVEVTHEASDVYPWKVVANGMIESQHRLKQEAEEDARDLAKKNRPSKLVIRRKSNHVSYTQRYEK